MSSDNSCLVLGAAIGYPPHKADNFVRTLLATGYRGAIGLMIRPADRDTFERSFPSPQIALISVRATGPAPGSNGRGFLHRAMARAPTASLCWALSHFLGQITRGFPERRARLLRLLVPHLPPATARFIVARRYLTETSHQRVVLSDVRDVIFQRDPFSTISPDELCIGIENDEYTIGTNSWNSEWVMAGYGAQGLRALAEFPVSCSGVTFGGREPILRYLDAMIAEILRLGPRSAWECLDQALHNHVVWTGRIEHVRHSRAMTGPIATLNGFSMGSLNVDENGVLLNRDGSVPSVVHMYDRVPGLAGRLRALQATRLSSHSNIV